MTDFATLVLAPNMAIHAIPVTFDPIFSRPGFPPYEGRGILTSSAVDIMLQDGAIVSDLKTTLGILLSDYGDDGMAPGGAPIPRDLVTLAELGADGPEYYIDDRDDDNQGGARLTLKLLKDTSPAVPG